MYKKESDLEIVGESDSLQENKCKEDKNLRERYDRVREVEIV